MYETHEKLFAIGALISTPDGPLSPSDGFVTTRYLFDSNSNVTQIIDDNIVGITRQFDGLDRLVRQDDDIGNYTVFAFDRQSNLIRTDEYEIGAPVGYTSGHAMVVTA